jgi:hypothetical protein
MTTEMDVRKTLLHLYSENTLQFAGFGIASVVALATELAGYDKIQQLQVPIAGVSLFNPILFSTVTFGALMFCRSAYWGRVTTRAVTKPYPSTGKEEDLMREMYYFHINSNAGKAPLGTVWIQLRYSAIITMASFIIGLFVH